MSLSIGDKAPEFSLYNTDKTVVNMEELGGKKIL
jgi:peroxiredoxin